MNIKALALFCITPVFLSACQVHPVSQASKADQLVISAPPLSRLPESATVDVSLVGSDQKVFTRNIGGIGRFPYHYKLPFSLSYNPEKVIVKVSLDGAPVLSGTHTLIRGQENPIELAPVQPSNSLTSLKGTYWRAIDLSGRGIPASAETTLVFKDDSRIVGYDGCNRYQGTYRSVSPFLEIDEVATTRKICSSSIKYHEERYLKLLKSAERFTLIDGDLAIFVTDKSKPLLFSKVSAQDALISWNAH